jgi:hypothetical protein
MNMRASIRALVRWTALASLVALCGHPASASTSIFVSLPPHSEEALTWCGPATAQMVMEGYPAGACTKPQDEVWLAIQAAKTETVWDTDPNGMRAALAGLCPPPAGSWSVFHDANASSLMYSVAYWMNKRKYPTALLLSTESHNAYSPHQEHWVGIRGIVTDTDPLTHSTVTLEMIWFTDPGVNLGDPPLQRMIMGSTFYTEFKAVTKAPSSFTGQFVAVVEPPPNPGTAVAPPEVLTGRVIPKLRVVALATLATQKIRPELLPPPFRGILQSKAMEPLLVNPKRGGYYLIPFSRDGRTAEFAVLLNAYTGALQEIGSFSPTRFIPEQESVSRAVRSVGGQAAAANPELLTTETGGSRYRPVWRVQVDGRPVLLESSERAQQP